MPINEVNANALYIALVALPWTAQCSNLSESPAVSVLLCRPPRGETAYLLLQGRNFVDTKTQAVVQLTLPMLIVHNVNIISTIGQSPSPYLLETDI